MDLKDELLTYAVEKVPGTAKGVDFYLIDNSNGLAFIDAKHKKSYVLTSERS